MPYLKTLVHQVSNLAVQTVKYRDYFIFFNNIVGDNDGVIHDFDANPTDNSCNLNRKKSWIVDEKEKQT